MTQLPDTSTEAGQREASVMLARLMGWHIGNKETTERGAWIRVLCDDKGNDLGLRPPFGGGIAPKQQGLVPNSFFNLYRPANMALALRCIRWGMENSAEVDEFVTTDAYRILRLETGINDALNKMINTYAVVSIV